VTGRPLSNVLFRLIWLCMAPLVLIAIWLAWQDVRHQNEWQWRRADGLAHNIATSVDILLEEGMKASAFPAPATSNGSPPAAVSTLETQRFQRLLDRFDLPTGWSVALKDGTGADIARRSPQNFDSARDVDAAHRIVVASSGSAWSVVLEIPHAIDSAASRKAAILLAGAILAAVLLGLVGGIWTTRRIGEQVATLGEAAGPAPGMEISEIAAARRRIDQAAAQIESGDRQLKLWGDAFTNLEAGLAIADARTDTWASVNAAFARERGYTEAELIGQPVWDIFAPEIRDEARVRMATLGSVDHLVFEAEHLRKDGSRFPVQVDLVVLRDAAGVPINRLGLVLDISARKRSERELAERQSAELSRQRQARIAALNLMDDAQAAKRQAEAAADELRKLSQAVEQSVESIEITDLDARITYVNEAFLRQTGYTREEVIGRNPNFLQSGNTPRNTYTELWAALRCGRVWRGELYNRRKDGSEYVEFATISPIRRADGEVTHFVAVKDDITEKKRMGVELDGYRHHLEQLVTERTTELEHARANAEAANRAKTTFLASMSHEIRTPMNAILGFTHMLRRDAASSVDADRLDKIESAALHLLSVINDILDLSKIEAGRVELEAHDFALEAVLGHVATLIGESAANKGLTVQVDGHHVPHWLRGDLTRVRQALLNLAGNAVKFTDKGGIVLRARLVESEDNRYLIRFEVEDTGIGIAADSMPQLFHAFQQADASTTRRFGGTGLGLVITRELARAMGGDAGADSIAGKGSRFWFTVWLQRGTPVQPVPAPAGARAEDLRQRYAGARVLVVEDHALNREVASDLLQLAGLTVETAENGRVAVERLRNGSYDLILMDMLMPEMDGLAATRAIRQLPQGGTVPIIAMTANAFEDDKRACRDAGMNDFIAKPINLQALYSTLGMWLSGAGSKPVAATAAAASGAEASPAAAAQTGMEHDRDIALIMARLSREAGVDTHKGIAVLNGKQDKLVSLLRMMATTHRHDMQKLQSCLQAGAVGDALRIAHTLRGVAAMLGANVLFTAVGAVEAQLRKDAGAAPAEVAALVSAVDSQLDCLLEIVGNARDWITALRYASRFPS